MKKLPYSDGTWFLIPLRSGGFARGLIARHNGKGSAFGYFFGPKLSAPKQEIPEGLTPDKRILWGRFGDLGLTNGSWPILGSRDHWNPDEWPMPSFVRIDEHAGIAFISTYDPKTFKCISEKRCAPEIAETYPYDQMMGSGAAEIRLTKLLDRNEEKGRAADSDL